MFAQLASSALASQDDNDDEAEDEGETTLYFDAEEGTFVNEAGEEILVDVEGEEDEELEDDEDEDEEEEETPAVTSAPAGARTIRSRSTDIAA